MDLSSILDIIKYGSIKNKERVLQEQADAEKQYQNNKKEMERQMKEAGKSEEEIQKKVWTEQSQQLKQQKEKINILKSLTDWWQSVQPKETQAETETNKETPKETPTTPTPEVLEEFVNMLGLGTTWATEGKANYPDTLVPYANEAGSQYGIDPIILAAQDAQETGGFGYEPRVGSSGEQGIPQIIPSYHYKSAGVGDSNTYASKLANDPKYAIQEQARILSGYLKGQGNIYDALRQYNAGSNLDNSGTYADEILKRAGLEKLIPGYNI